jgi:hypothetical protein
VKRRRDMTKKRERGRTSVINVNHLIPRNAQNLRPRCPSIRSLFSAEGRAQSLHPCQKARVQELRRCVASNCLERKWLAARHTRIEKEEGKEAQGRRSRSVRPAALRDAARAGRRHSGTGQRRQQQRRHRRDRSREGSTVYRYAPAAYDMPADDGRSSRTASGGSSHHTAGAAAAPAQASSVAEHGAPTPPASWHAPLSVFPWTDFKKLLERTKVSSN